MSMAMTSVGLRLVVIGLLAIPRLRSLLSCLPNPLTPIGLIISPLIMLAFGGLDRVDETLLVLLSRPLVVATGIGDFWGLLLLWNSLDTMVVRGCLIPPLRLRVFSFT
ncbi:hypothetical protein DPMN_175960 [Dreissena polymorpha]|uniref:Uncharacterized protein n=1 Tax=Dreissena polymorpha TaxID=45954 RepID=A0A9D4E7J9_DREPO|nr:hypothetical protein DPMN_175960 [Dreissena polymorpha]